MSDEKVYHGGVERLRRPERLAILQVEKVVTLALQAIAAKTVLDVGTGSGIFAEAFAARKLAVTGIDINEEMLAAARTFAPKGTFRIASSDSLPFRDESFDLVFLGVVLHETDDPLKSLREAHRVCALRTAVLEWPDAGPETMGPPRTDRLKSEDVFGFTEAAGFARCAVIHLEHLVLYVMEK